MIIINIVLSFLLSPGILVTLPPRSSKYIVAGTHAILFVLLTMIINHIYRKYYKKQCKKCGRKEHMCDGNCGMKRPSI
jgi:hypothetical protein